MRHATAVIGANYGDEGKGLVVDAMCDNGPDTVVVRFNGGAQAGHTVVTPDGRRHVFHHHGSGTLRGAATYLSEHFILNPLLFEREHKALGAPRVLASPQARLTTPYDMMLNQWAEEDRGAARHGSCGIGINETVDRCARAEWETTGINVTRKELRQIAHLYVPARAERLGVQLTGVRRSLLDSEAVIEQYLSACAAMRGAVLWRYPEDVKGAVVFEGAQGLLLDEEAPGFPHVTRSKTGLANVLDLCRQMEVTLVVAVFVTRTYLTRHGAGPMVGEDAAMSFPDGTNVDNPWQRGLRFGVLDVPSLLTRIEDEVANTDMPIRPSLAMTCVDQLDNEELRSTCSFPLFESRGPTRLTFRAAAPRSAAALLAEARR